MYKYVQTDRGGKENINANKISHPSIQHLQQYAVDEVMMWRRNNGYMAFMCMTLIIDLIHPALPLSPPLCWAVTNRFRNSRGRLTFLGT